MQLSPPLQQLLNDLDSGHPLRHALDALAAKSEEDLLWRLGEVAMSAIDLARLEDALAREHAGEASPETPRVGDATRTHATLLRGGRRLPLSEEDVAEIINALRDKENMVRRGWFMETTDGKEMSQWLKDLERLRSIFEPTRK